MGECSFGHSPQTSKASHPISSQGTQPSSRGKILACVILRDLPDSASRLYALGVSSQFLSTWMMSEKRPSHIKLPDQCCPTAVTTDVRSLLPKGAHILILSLLFQHQRTSSRLINKERA